MNSNKLSGLEMLRKVIKGELKASMDETISVKIDYAERGLVSGTIIAGIEHLSLNRGVHHGFHANVLSIITNYAFQTMIGAGVGFIPLDVNTKILRFLPTNKEFIIEGKVIDIFDHFGVSEGSIKDGAGCMYAHATASFYIP
jgi:acyl-coenzyme A thioesterase PaaI-like protein